MDALIEASTHKRKIEVEQFLAERFPSSDALPSAVAKIRVISPKPSDPPAAALSLLASAEPGATSFPSAAGPLSGEVRNEMLVLGRVANSEVHAEPRFHFQFVVPKSTHDKLCQAQALLSHSVPAGDLARVFDRPWTR